MKTITDVTIYKCEHCNKKMFRKHAMVKHEKYCGCNPVNDRVCSTCDFMDRKSIEYNYDGYDGEGMATAKGFYCSKLKKYMYPPFIENKRCFTEYPEQFEDQLPFKKECEFYTGNRTYRDIKINSNVKIYKND